MGREQAQNQVLQSDWLPELEEVSGVSERAVVHEHKATCVHREGGETGACSLSQPRRADWRADPAPLECFHPFVLRRYSEWKPTKEELEEEFAKNKELGERLGCWKAGMLVDNDERAVERALKEIDANA